MLANPDGTTALLDAAAIDPGASLSVEGSELIASNLSATSVSASAGGGVAATYAAVSDTTLDWIADFTAASINYAATLDGHDNARRYLLGQPRTVDQMETWIKGWGPANGHDFGTYQVTTNFGRYGSLPIVVVAVGLATSPENFFLLVDGVNGTVDGPFVSGGKLNPAQLLTLHSDAYASGTPWSVVRSDTGCGADFADTRFPFLPAPPLGTVPPGLVPVPGTVPGKPSPWTCTGGFTLPCVCTSTYNYQPAPGSGCPPQAPPLSSPGLCNIKCDVICNSGGATGGPCTGGPAGGAPPPPAAPNPGNGGVPGAPDTPGPSGGCFEQWWYWG